MSTAKTLDSRIDSVIDLRSEKKVVAGVRTYDRWIVSLLMLFVVVMSLVFFSNQSLRLDEAQSLWQTSHSPLGMLHVLAQDVHVPFYHFMLHFWQMAFGSGVMTARILSLIFFALTIPAIYMLGRFAYNRSIGLFSALLISISPFLNWYGNEIRMYSLFTLVTILNQYFFLKIYRRDSTGAWWGYAITVLIGAYTHYFFFFVLLTQAIFYFVYRKQFAVGSFKRLAGIAIALMVAFAPWVWYVIHLGGVANSTPFLVSPTSVNLFNAFSQFIFGFQNDHLNTILVSLWPLTILFGSLALRENRKVSSTTVFFIFTLLVPIATVFLVSVFLRPIFVTRYLILTVPSLYIFLGWMFSTYHTKLRLFLKTVLIATMLFTLGVQATSANVPVKENYRQVSEYLNTKTSPQDVVILSAPFTIYPVEYYYRGYAELRTLPIWNRYQAGAIPGFDETKLPDEVNTLKADHRIAWVVLSYDQGYESKVKDYFDSHFELLETKNFSNDLNLYAYKLRYDSISLDQVLKGIPSGSGVSATSTGSTASSSGAATTSLIKK